MLKRFTAKVVAIAAAFTLVAGPAFAVDLVGGGATFANPILDAAKVSSPERLAISTSTTP